MDASGPSVRIEELGMQVTMIDENEELETLDFFSQLGYVRLHY